MWPFDIGKKLDNFWTSHQTLYVALRTKLEDLMSEIMAKVDAYNAKTDQLLALVADLKRQIDALAADKADMTAAMSSMDAEMAKVDAVLNPPAG